jgi:hypothetical protein
MSLKIRLKTKKARVIVGFTIIFLCVMLLLIFRAIAGWLYLMSLNYQYVVREQTEIVGTWKVTSEVSYFFPWATKSSYLILHNDNTFEFHNLPDYAKNHVLKNSKNFQIDKSNKIISGKWEYVIGKQSYGVELYPCGRLRLSRDCDFITVGNRTHTRLLFPFLDGDGWILMLDKTNEKVAQ